VWNKIRELRAHPTRPESGQTNVEYALILVLIALATVLVLLAMRDQTAGVLLNSVADSLR
jgi:Flp pilus assembly pilin Flp